MSGRAFVIGAGLAGLCTAVRLAEAGARVTLLEAAGQAGGRCRSYHDATLDMVIDNGNHLVMSGNQAVQDYLTAIHARRALSGPARAEFPFMEMQTGAHWMLAPDDGLLPFWIARAGARVPGTKVRDYIACLPLLWAGKDVRVADCMPVRGPLWERLMRPFLLAALNTRPEEASAALAGAVVRGTFMRGGRAYRPRIASPTLAAAFVEPALTRLAVLGGVIRLGARARALTFAPGGVSAVDFSGEVQPLDANDVVVLATPPWVTGTLMPGLAVPDDFRAIVNGHFRMTPPVGAPSMQGLIGGTAEWLFCFADRVSVTVSAADALAERPREEVVALLWADVVRALGLTGMPLPPWQIVKEKRATFAATPAQDRLRPGARTTWPNLFLAGDWTDTGLPATIEGALRSGEKAAALAARHLHL